MAAGSHLTKSGSSRALINTSPEPFSNWAASFSEDTLALAGLWAALKYPLAFLALLALFIACALWLLPRLWRGVKRMHVHDDPAFALAACPWPHSPERAVLTNRGRSTPWRQAAYKRYFACRNAVSAGINVTVIALFSPRSLVFFITGVCRRQVRQTPGV